MSDLAVAASVLLGAVFAASLVYAVLLRLESAHRTDRFTESDVTVQHSAGMVSGRSPRCGLVFGTSRENLEVEELIHSSVCPHAQRRSR